MERKPFIVVVLAITFFAILFYVFAQSNDENIVEVANVTSPPAVSWQHITIAEPEQEILIHISVPRIEDSGHDSVGAVNKEITQYLELLKNEFIHSVSTVAYNNGETNTLNIDAEILLINPQLLSLAFTETEHLAGVQDKDSERTFLVFDLLQGKLMLEDVKLFHDDLAWANAVEIIKTSLLSAHQGNPSCDLLFAPKSGGLAASCIGVDWSKGGEHLSIAGDIPVSMIHELLAPAVLSDVTR